MLDLVDRVAGKNRTDLARQIQTIIKNFTFGRPMPPDEIICTMAFCVGIAVGNRGDLTKAEKRQLIEKVMKFFGDGQAVAEGKVPASKDVILPLH